MATPFQQNLLQATVGDLIKNKPALVWVYVNSTVKDAIKLLNEKNVLAVAVLDIAFNFVGFVDVLDLAGFALQSFQSDPNRDASTPLTYASHKFFDTEVNEVLNFSRVDLPSTIGIQETAAVLLRQFTDPNIPRLHRVAVIGADGKPVNVITQSDLVNMSAGYANAFSSSGKTLAELGLDRAHPHIVARLDEPFFTVLQTLYNNRVSGLAIVNEEGQLTGNISASDLRGLTEASFEHFHESVFQFLSRGTVTQLEHKANVSCESNSTFAEALVKVATRKVHRIYVTDSYDHPYGVVVLSDFLALVARG